MRKNKSTERQRNSQHGTNNHLNGFDNITQLLLHEREEYSLGWSKDNAEIFTMQGHYAWMASQIDGYERVIEIGTGTGQSTLELARQGHKIISIDENTLCLNMAEEVLTGAGIDYTRLHREQINDKGNRYAISYEKVADDITGRQVVLIEGDILNDPELVKWLHTQEPYDAIVCWLIGTHGGRRYNEVIDFVRTNTPARYRLLVQNEVYEIADTLLRPSGILNIVDRTQVPDNDQLMDDFLDSHREQASVTSLNVKILNYREYTDPMAQGGVRMRVSAPISGKVPNVIRTAFTSIIADKP